MGKIFANIGLNAIQGIGMASMGLLTAETGIGVIAFLSWLSLTGASIIALPIAYLFRKKQEIK